jgi:Flp pilus assembly protein TadG
MKRKRPSTGPRPAGGQRPGGSERGAGLAEFALVLPLLIIIIFGIFELGIAFNRAQAIEAAAREGARLASLSSTTAGDIATRVDETLVGIPLDNPVDVAVAPAGCAGREGEAVTVRVATVHNISIPLVVDRDITLTGEAVFRCEA